MTDDVAAPPPEGTKKQGNWWKRRSKKAKFAIILAVLIALIAAMSSAGGGDKSDSGDDSAAVADDGGDEAAEEAAKNGPIVKGKWNGDCNQFSAGDEDACKAIRVSRVTCQWREDKMVMTVVIRNTFGAHVTVHMNPIYTLDNAGKRGDGLTAVKDIGLDPGEVRTYETEQEPKGVEGQPKITSCTPGIDILGGVELG